MIRVHNFLKSFYIRKKAANFIGKFYPPFLPRNYSSSLTPIATCLNFKPKKITITRNFLRRDFSTNESFVFEVNMENFQKNVISSKIPVILDCYASWCQPCKQLTPVLEQVVRQAGGKLALAKLDVDAHPQMARQLGIQTLPTVACLFQGKTVDRFTGIPPTGQLKAFFSKALEAYEKYTKENPEEQSPEAMVKDALQSIKEGNTETSAEVLRKFYSILIEQDKAPSKEPELKARCLAGLALCSAKNGDMEEAKKLVASIKASYSSQIAIDTEVSSAIYQVELMETEPAEEIDDLAAAVQKDAENHDARYKLAQKLVAHQKYAEAVEHTLQIVKRAKHWNNDAGRTLAIQIFDILGKDHELTKTGRKRLTALLFI